MSLPPNPAPEGAPRPDGKIKIRLPKPPPPPGTPPPAKQKVVKKLLSVEVPALKTGRMNERRLGRVIACQALYSLQTGSAPVGPDAAAAMVDFAAEDSGDKKAHAFAMVLVEGVLRHREELDAIIKPRLVGWEFDRVSPVNRAILRLSLYSLFHQKDIPHKVTLNEAVDLAKMFGEADDYKFINALLDRVRKELLPAAPKVLPEPGPRIE